MDGSFAINMNDAIKVMIEPAIEAMDMRMVLFLKLPVEKVINKYRRKMLTFIRR